jgi:hypothetical protein
MKKFFLLIGHFACINATAQYNFYYGNIHAHTSYSDGNKDSTTTGNYYPGQDFYYAKSSYHMDFLGISEHNHYSANNNPGMHVADYARGLYQADTANNNGTFVSMFGFEWGIISNGGHVVTYGVPGLVGWETGAGAWGSSSNYNIFCAKSVYTDFWPIINSYPTAFCTLAHPQTADYNDLLGAAAYNAAADTAVIGVAIRSGDAFSTTTDYSDAAPTLYESSYLKALARGYHTGPTSDHDNHYTTFGRTNHGRTVVLATSLNRDSIMAAYKARRFYASDDWDAQVTFTVNGNMMGSIANVNANSSIYVSVVDAQNNTGAADQISKIEMYYGVPKSGTNATILTTVVNANTLNFTHPTVLGNQYYYFAKITQVDGDIIWTSPVWIKNTGVLPITMLDFAANENNENIDLSWTTALEINNIFFEIESSIDGINFKAIEKIFSKNSNSTRPTNYFSIDKNAQSGRNYYRLKQVDLNGVVNYSNTISIYKMYSISKIIINPNPVQSRLNIQYFSKNDEDVVCKIYSNDGRAVNEFKTHLYKGKNNIGRDIAFLSKGIYFVVLSKPNMRIAESNFIKE